VVRGPGYRATNARAGGGGGGAVVDIAAAGKAAVVEGAVLPLAAAAAVGATVGRALAGLVGSCTDDIQF
jgi:hypothetical protein